MLRFCRFKSLSYFVALGALLSASSAHAQQSITILPLGASTVAGYQGTNAGFRGPLYYDLVAEGLNPTFIGEHNNTNPPDLPPAAQYHSGYYGATIAATDTRLLNLFNPRFGLNYQPNIILVQIGTNDINQNIDIANAPARMTQLLSDIYSYRPNATVIVGNLLPIVQGNATSGFTLDPTKDPSVLAFDASLAGSNGVIAQRQGAGQKVSLVDLRSVIDYPSDMSDSLHPNQGGYDKLATVWLNAINQSLGISGGPSAPPLNSNGTSVPEPSTMALEFVALAAASILVFRKARGRRSIVWGSRNGAN